MVFSDYVEQAKEVAHFLYNYRECVKSIDESLGYVINTFSIFLQGNKDNDNFKVIIKKSDECMKYVYASSKALCVAYDTHKSIFSSESPVYNYLNKFNFSGKHEKLTEQCLHLSNESKYLLHDMMFSNTLNEDHLSCLNQLIYNIIHFRYELAQFITEITTWKESMILVEDIDYFWYQSVSPVKSVLDVHSFTIRSYKHSTDLSEYADDLKDLSDFLKCVGEALVPGTTNPFFVQRIENGTFKIKLGSTFELEIDIVSNILASIVNAITKLRNLPIEIAEAEEDLRHKKVMNILEEEKARKELNASENPINEDTTTPMADQSASSIITDAEEQIRDQLNRSPGYREASEKRDSSKDAEDIFSKGARVINNNPEGEINNKPYNINATDDDSAK